MSDLALEEKLSGSVQLYDIDYKTACDNEIIGNNLKDREEVKFEWYYKAAKNLKDALTGVDFVIIFILPGTFKEMESDVHTPEEYKIYQSVGDTVGPGGIIRALRTIPMFEEIGEAIKKYAPDAWVINYTNPMTLSVRTLYEVFPEIKAFGCCHEVFGTQRLLARLLGDLEGIKGVRRQEIKVNILGINHFTWLDKTTYKGMDLFPVFDSAVKKYFEDGFGDWNKSYFDCAHRVKFDLFKRYGLIAAAGDRHLAEFVLGNWYLKDPETVKKWHFHLTPVSWRIKNKNEKIDKAKRLIEGEEEFEISPTGEEGVEQMKALLGLENMITNVNIPNQGQIDGIARGCS